MANPRPSLVTQRSALVLSASMENGGRWAAGTIGVGDPARWPEPLIPVVGSVNLTSGRRLSIDGEAMYRFAALARDWEADLDPQFVDWIYAQPPESWSRPRELVLEVSGVARKLVQDQRFLKADAQLLHDIEQRLVGNPNLSRSESVRLDRLILKIDLKKPESASEADNTEIRMLLRKAVSDR
jgi:hypothetical protein